MCPVRAAGGQEQVVGSTGWASQERHSAPCCHLCAQSGCVLELKDGPISQEKLEIWVSRNTMMKRKKKTHSQVLRLDSAHRLPLGNIWLRGEMQIQTALG